MPTIRIDDEVWEKLKKLAVPFEDTPNTVLRRLLSIDGQATRKQRSRTTDITAHREFRRPILEALAELGGEGRVTEVLDRVGKRMKEILRPGDYENVSGGEIRWRNAARFERENMKGEGLLKSDSPRGYWQITENGRNYLRKTSST